MGAVALGVYVLAFNVASWPSSLLGSVLRNVSGPAFSRVRDDPDRLKEAIGSALRAVSLVAIPMCTLIMVLARPIVLTIYGARWAAAASVLSVLSLYSAVSVICTFFASILAGIGRAKYFLTIQLIWLGVLVPAMWIGVHRDGIVGAASAHIAVIVPIVLPSYLFALRRATGISFAMLANAVKPALLASLVIAFAAREVASLPSDPLAQLVAGLTVGGLIFLVTAAPSIMLASTPQLVDSLTRGRSTGPRLSRILRFYSGGSKAADSTIAVFPGDRGPANDGFCFVCGSPNCMAASVHMIGKQHMTGPMPAVSGAGFRVGEPAARLAPRSGSVSSLSVSPGLVVPVAPPAPANSPAPSAPLTKTMTSLPATWTVLVSADRAYYDRVIERNLAGSAIAFPGQPAQRRIPLAGNRMRIGRRNPARFLQPEIDLADQPTDPGISRLHAVLIAGRNGTWSLLDTGSANGTLLNGREIAVGELIPLHDGDRINLGAWTAITLCSS
jgi:hypothetical protein